MGAPIYPIELDPQFDWVAFLAHFDEGAGQATYDVISGDEITLAGSAILSEAQVKFGLSSLYCTGVSSAQFSVQKLVDKGFGVGDFCVELWYYPTGTAVGSDRIFQTRDGDIVTGVYIAHTASNTIQYAVSVNGGAWGYLSPAVSIALNDWNHIVLERVSGEVTFYVGGAVEGGNSYSGDLYMVGTDTAVIGGQSNGRSNNGYINDLRVTANSRYNGAFTPPTEPSPDTRFEPGHEPTILDPYFSSVVSLIQGGNGIDPMSDNIGNSITFGGSAITQSGTITKFATHSYYTSTANFDVAVSIIGNIWTIEGWVRDSQGGDMTIFDNRIGGGQGLVLYQASGAIRLWAGIDKITSGVIAVDVWTHFAVTCDGVKLRLFLDGAMIGEVAFVTALSSSSIRYGYNNTSTVNTDFTGYWDSLRISSDVARYTAAFTIPTEAFPNFEYDPLEILGYEGGATAPIIVTQPMDVDTDAGAVAIFSVEAFGEPPLRYQWYAPGPRFMIGETARLLAIEATPEGVGDYYCGVFNYSGGEPAISDAAALTVTVQPPVVLLEPSDTTVVENTLAKFEVSVSGYRGLAYQWSEVGVGDLSGENGYRLTLGELLIADTGRQFLCTTDDGYGNQVVSATATLTVIEISLIDNTEPGTPSDIGPQRQPHHKHQDFVGLVRAALGPKPTYNDDYRFSGRTFRTRDILTNTKDD